MRTLTLTIHAPDRNSITNALLTLAATITNQITQTGQTGSVAQQQDVHWQWHLTSSAGPIDYSSTQALHDHNIIDQDEKQILDQVNPDTIHQACKSGLYTLKQLILLHAALQGRLKTGISSADQSKPQ